MSISTHPERDAIYAMHRRWLTVELLEGGSLLTPGASIWTNEHLAELTQHFVENPDAGGEDFLTKLRGQLREVSPEAVQLMAELHIIYFLIIRNGAVSAAKKLENIETILSWMPSPPRVSDDIREAMEVGLVHPGQWVLTRRDLQIAWTINFASLFRMRSDAAAIAADPWALRTFTEKLHDKRAEGARLGLLHLSHPDTFYATVSPKHRKQIYDRFSGLTEHTEDLDRALIDIQAALEEVYGEHLEFYADPLVHQWARDPQWRRFMTWTERVRDLLNFDADERDYKLSVASEVQQARTSVLDGDSDWLERLTSAFHSSRNNLTTWRSHDPVLTWMGKHPEEARSALFEFWTESDRQAKHWPRLLADRVDALIDRFPSDLIPTPGARLSIVGFLMMAEGAEQHPPITARLLNRGWDLTHWKAAPSDSSVGWRYVRWLTFLDEVLHDNARKGGALRDRLDVQSAVWMMVRMKEAPPSWKDELWAELQGFRGPVTVAAENESEQYEPGAEDDDDSSMPSEELRDRLQEVAEEVLLPRESVDELVALLEAKGQLILYGPPGTGKTFVALKLARALAGSEERSVVVQFHPSTSYEDFIEGLRPELTPSGQVTYALRSGPLVLMAEAARAQPDRTFVLVIDEINRANLPKVFGELLFLLEYREESARLMYRPEEPFRLPGNLLIIGTMNTADRSVALIDAAMRRRFNFVPFFPDQGPMAGILHRWLNAKGGQSNIATFLDAVNEELRELLGDHQSIGPSHFMQTSLTNVALRRIWEANVFPLLEEFFWGDAEVERWRWPAVSERYAGILDPSTPSTSVAPNDDPREVEGQDN